MRGPIILLLMGVCSICSAAVKCSVDHSSGALDVAFDELNVELRGLNFVTEIDGVALPHARGKSESVRVESGTQITEHWGEAVVAERVVRVYDRLPLVTISARLINKSNRP